MSTASVAAGMRAHKAAGLALIIGALLTAGAALLYPGALDGFVDRLDFGARVDAVTGSPNMTHVTTLASIFGVVLLAFGAFYLFRLAPSQASLAGLALRFGIGGMLFSWGVYVAQMSTSHTIVPILAHGVGEGTGPEVQAELNALALSVYAAGAVLHYAFLSISCVASILMGLGLAARFASMNLFKAAAYGLVLLGVLLGANLAFVQHVEGLGPSVMLTIAGGSLWIGVLCWIVLRVGLYQGQADLVPDEE
ncbi:MAG: hypothetical protein J4F32_02940 [Dehalococcoidia bacterium]|nr:hypothetical protein [Dehalococcoidia bacterium]